MAILLDKRAMSKFLKINCEQTKSNSYFGRAYNYLGRLGNIWGRAAKGFTLTDLQYESKIP